MLQRAAAVSQRNLVHCVYFISSCVDWSLREGSVVRSAVDKTAALFGVTTAPLPCSGTCIAAPYAEPAECCPHYHITEEPI